MHRTPWFLALTPALVFACAACTESNPVADADVVSTDVGSDAFDGLELHDEGPDVTDASMDVPVDVQPARLPGRWRLVGFSSTSAGGATLSLTDADTRISYSGRNTYGRANGTMSLAADRMESTVAVLIEGHVLTVPTVGSASEAMAVFGSATSGTLGAESFAPASGPRIAFTTSADGAIHNELSLGSFGRVQLAWARADALAAPAGLSSQGLVIQLQAGTAAPLAHPRVAVAWDRPGLGAGYTTSNDLGAVFAGGGNTAAVPVLVTYVLPEYTTAFDGTSFSIGYVIAYDDVNDNGRFDSASAIGPDGGTDGGPTMDASVGSDGSVGPAGGDPVRGVSRVLITVRSFEAPSAAFLASPFRDVPGGVQMGALRDDATVPGGVSVGSFDTTHTIVPDGVVEAGGTQLPDLI